MTDITYRDHLSGAPRSYVASASASGIVWACGQVPTRDDGRVPESMDAQVRQAFANLDRVLNNAGSSLGQIVKMTIYLADLDEFDEYDAAYRECFSGLTLPPRTTVEVARFRGEKRIEIDAVAVTS